MCGICTKLTTELLTSFWCFLLITLGNSYSLFKLFTDSSYCHFYTYVKNFLVPTISIRHFSFCEWKHLMAMSWKSLLIWVTLGRKNDLYLDLPCYAIFSGIESNYFPAKGKSRDSNYSTNNDFEIMLTYKCFLGVLNLQRFLHYKWLLVLKPSLFSLTTIFSFLVTLSCIMLKKGQKYF